MSKKTSNYIVGILIALWLVILYVKFSGGESDSYEDNSIAIAPENQGINDLVLSNNLKKISLDTLYLDYKDPFLEKAYQAPTTKVNISNNNTQSFTNPSHTVKANNIKTIQKPNIIYKGIIAGDKNLGIIKLNDKTLFVKEQETYDSLFIKKVTDSVILISVSGNEFIYNK